MSSDLGPDPAVPQRDLLLDSRLVRDRLGPVLGLVGRIHECHRMRVKYRVGARLRVVYRVRTASTTFDVAASTFPTLARSQRAYADASERAVTCGALRPVALDRELATVFWTFPNDRKLTHLAELSVPVSGLTDLLPSWSRSVLVSYAPEKAATVRCVDGTGKTIAYAKTYAGDEGERADRVHDALEAALAPDDPYVRVPRSFAYSTAHRSLLVEALGGVPLQAPEIDDLRIGYRRLGRALARFHDLPPLDSARFRRLDPDRLVAAAGLIGAVRADVRGTARALADEVARRLDTDPDVVCLHGDVNFRNALLENGRVALIDLDQVAAGPPAAELGSVLASLRYAGAVGLLEERIVPKLCAAFLAGYAELRSPPAATALRTYTAAAVLAERCLRVVTRVRSEGLRRLPLLLAEARDVLA